MYNEMILLLTVLINFAGIAASLWILFMPTLIPLELALGIIATDLSIILTQDMLKSSEQGSFFSALFFYGLAALIFTPSTTRVITSAVSSLNISLNLNAFMLSGFRKKTADVSTQSSPKITEVSEPSLQA